MGRRSFEVQKLRSDSVQVIGSVTNEQFKQVRIVQPLLSAFGKFGLPGFGRVDVGDAELPYGSWFEKADGIFVLGSPPHNDVDKVSEARSVGSAGGNR